MRNLLITIIAVLLANCLIAQVNSVGIEGGASIVNMTGNDLLKKYNYNKAAIAAGFSSYTKIYRFVMLKAGLYYEQKGMQTRVMDAVDPNNMRSGTFIVDYNLNYITILFSVGGRIPLNKSMDLYLGFGAYAGYLLKEQRFTHPFQGSPSFKYDYTHFYKPFDLGLNPEIDLFYTVAKKIRLNLGVRYGIGFTNISARSGQISNRSATLSTGFNYLYGK